jgi:class 3 adenylate cyclase
MRIGLNAGEVVRPLVATCTWTIPAVGQTVHLAARMEQMAMPGSILLTAEASATGRGLCPSRTTGLVHVKGLPEPVDAF